MVLRELRLQSIQKAVNRLFGTPSGGSDKATVGLTVQPVVNVNLGEIFYITNTGIAGNTTTQITVPPNKRWCIEFGKISLTTDGTVATRTIEVKHYGFEDLTNLSTYLLTGAGVTASASGSLYMDRVGPGSTSRIDANDLHDVVFFAGDRIQLSITNGVAGDTYAYYLRIREYDMRD